MKAAETLTKFRTDAPLKKVQERSSEKALEACHKLHRGPDGRFIVIREVA